ncbi:hypothetical protein D3C73_1305870 [compost metagenome]
MVATGVDGGCINAHLLAALMLEAALEQVFRHADPDLILGWVAVKNLVFDRPHFLAAPKPPDADFDPVALRVATCQQQGAAHGHHIVALPRQSVRLDLRAPLEFVGLDFLDFAFPSLPKRRVPERL